MAEKDVDEQFAAIMAHWDDVALVALQRLAQHQEHESRDRDQQGEKHPPAVAVAVEQQ